MTNKERIGLQLPIFVAARTVINTMQRMIYPLLPVFGRGLGVDLEMLSLAVSLRSATGLFGPFLASFGDARGRKAGMLLGMVLLTAAGLVMTIWPTYPAFVAMLILSIMANFIFIPSVQAYLGDRVPYQRRGRVIAITEFGWSLSFIIGVPLVGVLIARHGWQAPFPWFAAAGLLSILVLALVVPNDRPHAAQVASLRQNLGVILRHPGARMGILLGILMSGANELVNLIFGVWLEDTFQVRLAALAIASVVIGFSELGGEGLVSVLADRLGKRRATGLGLIGNALAALALPWLGSSANLAMVGLSLFYITFEFTMVSALPLMTEVVPRARATFIAAFIASTALGRALGSLGAPQLYRLGGRLESLPSILLTVVAAALLDLLGLAILRLIHEGEQEPNPAQKPFDQTPV